MKSRKLAIANLGSLLLVFLFNFLTGSGYINDLSQKEISDMFPTAITPKPFAFSIWGVIYTLVAIAIILMVFRYKETEYHDTIQAISYWFLLSSGANILWTVSFSYLKMVLSTLLIFILLFSLVMILKQLSTIEPPTKTIFPLAFGMYAGWVLIATVLNVAVTLVQKGWNGWGISDTTWLPIILIVSVVIVFLVTINTKNSILPLPVAWAYYAIYLKESCTVALIGMVILFALSIYQVIHNKNKLQI